MYKKNVIIETDLKVNQSMEGETIEKKVRRIMENKEPITDRAEQVFTERKDGVLEATDIRTDRFDVAIDAMDKVASDKIAKRENKLKAVKGDNGAEGPQSNTGTGGEPQ
ncbi:MAG: hypothetical protein [Microviridae sp.]|nr:MAG: hypothetical protein [Microviridae sp.]